MTQTPQRKIERVPREQVPDTAVPAVLEDDFEDIVCWGNNYGEIDNGRSAGIKLRDTAREQLRRGRQRQERWYQFLGPGALVLNYATLRAARCRELPHAPPRPRAAARARQPRLSISPARARAPPARAGALNSRTAPGQHRAKPERRTNIGCSAGKARPPRRGDGRL